MNDWERSYNPGSMLRSYSKRGFPFRCNGQIKTSLLVTLSIAFVFFASLALIISTSSLFCNFVTPFRSSVHNGRDESRTMGRTAVNILESKFYEHHPVMQLVPQETVLFDKDYLTEINSLRVPLAYDCENFGNRSWGGYAYFKTNPSRWYSCWLHYAALQSGMPGMIPPLPLLDEEYFEQVAVYDSVVRAQDKYVFLELGARWGTWGARAIAFLKQIRADSLPYELMFVEALSAYCEGLREVMKVNNMTYSLSCSYATPEVFLRWASNQSHINVIDFDIQGAESDMLKDGQVMSVVEEKVHRLIIGTHSAEIHEEMQKKFNHWVLVHDMPMTTNVSCIRQFLRTPPRPDRSNFHELVNLNCYHNSSFGMIANYDGELIVDNPRFYQGHILFPDSPSQ